MFDLLAQVSNNDGSGAAAVGGGLMIIVALIGLALFVLWVWALIDCIGNASLDGTMKIVWILVIIFTGGLGAIIYLLVARSGKSRAMG